MYVLLFTCVCMYIRIEVHRDNMMRMLLCLFDSRVRKNQSCPGIVSRPLSCSDRICIVLHRDAVWCSVLQCDAVLPAKFDSSLLLCPSTTPLLSAWVLSALITMALTRIYAPSLFLCLFILAHRLDPQHGDNMTHIDQYVLACRHTRNDAQIDPKIFE